MERQGRTVAWLEHGADTRAVAELPAVMSLALERKALRVAQLLQQTELRASTARLVAAGERERHRLERDLHDGAQQRLLALNLAIGAAHHNAPPAEAELLARAGQRLSSVQNELRRLAHAGARVAALGGVLAVEPEAGGARVRGWVPSYPG